MDPSLSAVVEYWDDLIEEADRIAAKYEDDGWETVRIHTGEVTTPSKDTARFGLSILAPTSEYNTVRELVEDRELDFEESAVFRRQEGAVIFLVVAVLDTPSETAIVFPAYFALAEADTLLETATEQEEVATSIRSLNPDEQVTFTHDDPTLFLPESLLESVDEE